MEGQYKTCLKCTRLKLYKCLLTDRHKLGAERSGRRHDRKGKRQLHSAQPSVVIQFPAKPQNI